MGRLKKRVITVVLLVSMILTIFAVPTQTHAETKATEIVTLAKKQLGKKYIWATSGPSSFDCSGFTYYVFKKTANKTLPRSSTYQAKYGKYVSRKNLKKGDLVFFATTGSGRVSHAGIYLGNSKFIHASSTQGKVVISSMSSGHYYSAFVNGRRV